MDRPFATARKARRSDACQTIALFSVAAGGDAEPARGAAAECQLLLNAIGPGRRCRSLVQQLATHAEGAI